MKKRRVLLLFVHDTYLRRKSKSVYRHMLEIVCEFNQFFGYKVNIQKSMLEYEKNDIFYNSIKYLRTNLTKDVYKPYIESCKNILRKIKEE